MGKGKGVWTACYLDLFDSDKVTECAAHFRGTARGFPRAFHSAIPCMVPSWVLKLNLTMLNRLSTDGLFRVRTPQGFLSTVWPDYSAEDFGQPEGLIGQAILDAMEHARFVHRIDGDPSYFRLHEYELHNSKILKDRARNRGGSPTEPRAQVAAKPPPTATATATATSSSSRKKGAAGKKPKKQLPKEAVELAEYLLQCIKEHSPKVKAPTSMDAWATDLDKAMRLDGRTTLELSNMIHWAHIADERGFWHGNLLSGAKVRKHFDTINAQMGRSEAPPRRSVDASKTVHGLLQEMEGEL